MTHANGFAADRARFTLPLAERRGLLANGTISAAAFRRQLVGYVREVDPDIRAFADWRPADLAHSPVPWVPSVTYKDTIDVAGYPTRLGISAGYRRYPARSAEIARRLSGRGLVCVGKAATTECSLGSVKPSRNPLFPHVSAAGSSTGSAAAVAAGFCDISVGTDSGGSLRWPAVYCGTVALRLTPRSALLRGVHAVAPSMESVGLVARTVADLCWVWRSYRLAELFGSAYAAGLARLRFAVAMPSGEAVHPEVGTAVAAAGDALSGCGGIQVRPDLSAVWASRTAARDLLAYEAYTSFAPLLGKPGVGLHADTRLAIEHGAGVGQARYLAARQVQRRIRAQLATLLETDCDILVLPLEPGLPDLVGKPPVPTVPPPGRSNDDQSLTTVASLGCLPVLALPLRLSSQRSPIGVQLLARPAGEEILLAAGQRLADSAGPLGQAHVPQTSPEMEPR